MKQANLPLVRGLGGREMSEDGETVVLEVFLASKTKDGDDCVNFGPWVERLNFEMASVCGGVQDTRGSSSWVNPDTGKMLFEYTAILRSFVSRSRLVAGLPRLRQALIQYGRECEQHTVAFALDGEFFGIDPTQPY